MLNVTVVVMDTCPWLPVTAGDGFAHLGGGGGGVFPPVIDNVLSVFGENLFNAISPATKLKLFSKKIFLSCKNNQIFQITCICTYKI